MNLILLEPQEIDDRGTAIVRGPRALHIAGVLKAAPGQTVRVGVIDGPMGTATVMSADDASVTLTCALDDEVPERPRVDLLLALPRPKVMRRLWAQLAALGVGRIALTNAGKVERNYFDTHVLHEPFYRGLLVEGLQQARDTRLPLVSIHRQLKVLIEDEFDAMFGDGLRIAADPCGTTPLAAAARGHGGRRLLVAIGPEGGWNAYELSLLQAHGFRLAGLGPRTLRVDTACTAVLAILHSEIAQG